MTHIRLGLGLGLISLVTGCGALGQYGTMLQQPGAGQPSSAAATPANAVPATSPVAEAAAEEKSEAAKGPSTVSVTIKSSCSKTVRVFFGDKPKFGSGKYSTVSSNSRSSHTFQPGDQLWIVDDKDNGLSNASVSEGTREIEILSSCSGLKTG